MSVCVNFLLSSLVASLAVAGPLPAVERQRNWQAVNSPNFTVRGDASAGDLRLVASRLEQFRDVFSTLFPRAVQAASHATTVVVFRSPRAFEPFKPRYQGKATFVAGYFIGGEAVDYIAMDNSANDAFRLIYHEYVHAIVNAIISSPPVWFNEGLAEYYKGMEVTGNGSGATVGRLENDHVLRLRSEWLPLASVLAVDHNSPLYNERDKASVFYAESWALVHYLLLGDNGVHARQFAEFSSPLMNGIPPEAASQKAFGLTIPQLEKKLRGYLASDRFPFAMVKFSSRIASLALPAAPMADAEAHATLGELLLRLQRPDEARVQLDAALALDSGCGPAHESMGRLLAGARQFDRARDHLAAAVAGPGATWLTHYTYGRTLLEARSGTAGDDEIARAFARAVEMKPDFADGYAELAWVRSQSPGGLDDALRAARKATELEPGKDEHSMLLANVLANRQDFAASRAIADRLARKSTDAHVQQSARDLLAQIDRIEHPAEGLTRAAADSDGGSSTTAGAKAPPSPGFIPAFREIRTGELRKAGKLTRIDCPRSGLTFTIATKDGALVFGAARFEDVEFITYREDLAGRVQCGLRTPPDVVLVTYQPAASAGRLAGQVVAVEFPPAGYVDKP